MVDVLTSRWSWYWRLDEESGEPNCGIFAEVREGQAYSVARCPRYVSFEDWSEYATHICELHNKELFHG